MNKMKLLQGLAFGLLFSGMVRANEVPYCEDGPDLDAIEYIEEEEDTFNLGFETSDYLPDNFDPYTFYMDLKAIDYVKGDVLDFDPATCLPANFNPYAYPENFRHISYIEPSEEVIL